MLCIKILINNQKNLYQLCNVIAVCLLSGCVHSVCREGFSSTLLADTYNSGAPGCVVDFMG